MSENGQQGLAAALVAAQAEMPTLHKDAANPHFKSRFVSLGNLIDSTRPVLNRHGLALSQEPTLSDAGLLILRTVLRHTSGEERVSDMPLTMTVGATMTMQQYGSLITYARRYAWSAILGVAADDDDDGNGSSEPAPAPRGRRAEDVAPRALPPEPSAGVKLATDAQKRRIFASMHELGFGVGDKDRGERLAYVSQVVGRPVASSNDLTVPEAARLITELEQQLAHRTAGEKAFQPPQEGFGGLGANPPKDPDADQPPEPGETELVEQLELTVAERLDKTMRDSIDRNIVPAAWPWEQTAAFRRVPVEQLIDELGGRNSRTGDLNWVTLRKDLRTNEGTDLLAALLAIRKEKRLAEPDDIPF